MVITKVKTCAMLKDNFCFLNVSETISCSEVVLAYSK